MEVYIEHFLAGMMFAATGVYASKWCRHAWHQLIVGVILVALETIVVVTLVG